MFKLFVVKRREGGLTLRNFEARAKKKTKQNKTVFLIVGILTVYSHNITTTMDIVIPTDNFVLVIGDHPQVPDLVKTISQQSKNVTVKNYSGKYEFRK